MGLDRLFIQRPFDTSRIAFADGYMTGYISYSVGMPSCVSELYMDTDRVSTHGHCFLEVVYNSCQSSPKKPPKQSEIILYYQAMVGGRFYLLLACLVLSILRHKGRIYMGDGFQRLCIAA
ncbi:hypothetical protein LZ31DRAFT_553355 [Colletotrichum somersetense]|nr:hypothetical protein LZ31DRAFT_553355 [Colletotrichum somersetense]